MEQAEHEKHEPCAQTVNTEDMTPKRNSAIVQPIPRRIVPPNLPIRIVPPNLPTRSVAPWPTVSAMESTHGLSQIPDHPQTADDDDDDGESGPESSAYPPTEQNRTVRNDRPAEHNRTVGAIATGCRSVGLPVPMVDLSTRRVTAFRVSDLLGDGISAKKDTLTPPPMYPSPLYLPLKPFPMYPSTVMFMAGAPEANGSHDLTIPKREDTPPLDEDVPQKNLSVGGAPGSLTSSPISPKSDNSTSDNSHTDDNTSTDRETSPMTYKGSPDKKSNRINYTPMQVRRLETVFLETPYPEHEMYEQLSRDLTIPEPRLKVWFQNKRARWKRRVEDKITYPYPYPPFSMVPMGLPTYGMMPGSVTSPPDSATPSMFPYPASPSPMMMYPGAGGYPGHVFPYVNPQMFVQQ